MFRLTRTPRRARRSLGRALSPSLLLCSALVAPSLARAAVYPVVLDNTALDPLMKDLVIPGNASTQGMWSQVNPWPIVGLHLTMLPTGQVLSYGGTSVDGGIQDGRTFDVWDPAGGVLLNAHTQFPNAPDTDSFCSTGALLTNGLSLITGGDAGVDGYPSQNGTAINWSSLVVAAEPYQTSAPRWYASMITLGDGRQLISGGGVPYDTNAYQDVAANIANGAISMTPEVFTPTGGWSSLLGAESETAFGPDDNRWWYPRQFLLPNGNVFGITANQIWYLNPQGAGSVQSLGAFTGEYSETTLPNIGPTSTASMYRPGQVIQVGGNGHFNGDQTTSSAAATLFDLRNPQSPAVTTAASMHYPRQWGNSLVLPTGDVLVTGGSTFADNNGGNAVYAAETWSPTTGQWSLDANAAIYRGYHSATLLLQDGAVLSSGGGLPGPVSNFNFEVYYPPYLFTPTGYGSSRLATPPVIVSMSANTLSYGATLKLEMGDATPIKQISLVRLGVTTHSFNSGQYFTLPAFTQNGNLVSIAIPPNGNQAPPGYYHVFAVNGAGVPSRSAIVGIGNGVTAPTAKPTIVAPEPAGWTKALFTGAARISVAADGTTAEIYRDGDIVINQSSTGLIVVLPVKGLDIAARSSNSIWFIGSDSNVYHWQGSLSGAVVQVGVNASSIAASPDGGVVVVNRDYNTIWYKSTDDNNPNWQALPGKAKRVAMSRSGYPFSIGLDDNVYHWNGSAWVQVGINVQAISASPDGNFAVINNYDGGIWVKNQPANDADQGYTNIPGSGDEIAWIAGTTHGLITDAAENTWSR